MYATSNLQPDLVFVNGSQRAIHLMKLRSHCSGKMQLVVKSLFVEQFYCVEDAYPRPSVSLIMMISKHRCILANETR